MDIIKILEQSGALNQIANQYGLDNNQLEAVIKAGMPEISKAIKNNTSSEQGYKDFIGAINDHEQDDIEAMLKDINKVDVNDGSKILGHIFGDNSDVFQEKVARNAGVKKDNSAMIFAMLAPIILSMLGKAAKKRQISPDNISSDVFSSQNNSRQEGSIMDVFANSISQSQNRNSRAKDPLVDIVGGLLDQDGDGSILNDLGGILGKFL